MVESKNIESNNDTSLMLLTVSLLLISIVAFYYFSEIRLFYRVLGVVWCTWFVQLHHVSDSIW